MSILPHEAKAHLQLFCLMRQKHSYNYFALNESYLVEGKIASVVLLPHEHGRSFVAKCGGTAWCETNVFIRAMLM